MVDINLNEIEYYVNDFNCYNVMFFKYVDFDLREIFIFGGFGGYCCL